MEPQKIEIKPFGMKLMSELLKNSARSDRQLAKALGVSQPTVTRQRAKLEEKAIINYMANPDLEQLGFQLMAFTLLRPSNEGIVRLKSHPNVILASHCRQDQYDTLCISVHKTFNEFCDFINLIDPEHTASTCYSNIQDKTQVIKPLGFHQII